MPKGYFSSPLSQKILIFSMIICLNFLRSKSKQKNLSIIAADRIMGKNENDHSQHKTRGDALFTS
ncbi:conserved hypothetical protein [Klebsiella quasipneumoniae subsp. quasipneumoniae]|nr:conserved hypothetical protein [Klebsiella quasipneumoniae subsp. quasipneumoniae]